MISIEIYYGKHALEKLDAYGIEKNEVDNVIKKGMKWKEEHTEKWHALMSGIECVFLKQENSLFVITVYLNR